MVDFDSYEIKYPIRRSMTHDRRIENLSKFFSVYCPKNFPGFVQLDYQYERTGEMGEKKGFVTNNFSSWQIHGSASFRYKRNAPLNWCAETFEAGYLPSILANSVKNQYITVNYKTDDTRRRRKEDMGWLGGILIDLDKHDKDINVEKFVSFTAEKVLEGVSGGFFPMPTYIEHTGRGIQFSYRFSDFPLIEEKDCVKRVWEIIKDKWIEYIGADIVDMDGSVGDASRICRIAGTYNVNGDAYTYLISSSGILYTLKEICDSFDIDIEKIKVIVAESKDKPKKPVKKKSDLKKSKRIPRLTLDRTPIEAYESGAVDIRCFGKERFTKINYLQTLDRLFELRPDWTHKRDIFAHIYYNLLLPLRGKAEADVIIRSVYEKLCEKSSDIETFSIDELEHIRSTFYDGLGGITIYNYLKFETIADKLDISDEEIVEIGKTGYFERRHRKSEARANNIIRDKMRNLCKYYRLKGFTQKEVADLVNRDMGFKSGEKGACNVDYVRRYAAGINRKSNADEINLEENTAYTRKIVPAKEHKLRKISTISLGERDDVGGFKEKNDSPEQKILSTENDSIEKLLEDFSKGNNLTILGAGGTGKSYFISKAKQYCKESGKSYKTISFTGIASQNIYGITIHKALNLQSDRVGKILRHKDNPSLINASFFFDTDVIFVDEIGFIRSDLGLFLIKSIQMAEETTGHTIQLVWTGDFLQIPPVCKNDENVVLTEDGFLSTFLFSLPEWRAVSGNIINLKKNHRTTDEEYLAHLEKIRTGKCDISDIKWFNNTLDGNEDHEAVFIAGRRKTVQKINQEQISRLFNEGELKEYVTSADKKERCKFAVGMKVMITKNHGKSYQNGSRGIIIRMNRKSVTVKLDGNGKETRVEISGGWLPLTPCYAMTAHKAQGQTFESINLVADYGNGSEFFAPGQLYTVLSRVHDRNGVHLIGKLRLSDVIVDKEALAFQYGMAA